MINKNMIQPFALKYVDGDGNCFYRCLTEALNENPYLYRKILGIHVHNASDEFVIKLQRIFVGNIIISCFTDSANNDKIKNLKLLSRNMLSNLFSLIENGNQECKDNIYEMFPLMKRIINVNNLNKILSLMFDVVSTTNEFASQIEVEILKMHFSLCKIYIIILSQRQCVSNKKAFIENLKSNIPQLKSHDTNGHVIILVNHNNLHYNYFKMNGKGLIPMSDIIGL